MMDQQTNMDHLRVCADFIADTANEGEQVRMDPETAKKFAGRLRCMLGRVESPEAFASQMRAIRDDESHPGVLATEAAENLAMDTLRMLGYSVGVKVWEGLR